MIPISAAKRTDGVRYAIRDVVMKAREHAANGMQMLYLNIGDPIQFDFQTPPHIIDAITASMKAGNNGYGPSEPYWLKEPPIRALVVVLERWMSRWAASLRSFAKVRV